MKILISCFMPFNNEEINPSINIVESIEDDFLGNEIYKIQLNVEYINDSKRLLDKIRILKPDIVLCLGQAGGRRKVCLEYFAVNMRSAAISDNAGLLLKNKPISEIGLPAYKTNIDTECLLNRIGEENFAISYHAGTFICNDIYYNALEYIYKNKLNTKCGFIHVPFLPSQVVNKENMPSMELEQMVEVIKRIIELVGDGNE